MKKQLKGKQSFYDDKQRENVVSYYLMEDQEHTMYGVELEKYQEETNVIEWDADSKYIRIYGISRSCDP